MRKTTTQPTPDLIARAHREIDGAIDKCTQILAIFETLQACNRDAAPGINAFAMTDIGRDIAGALVEHLGNQIQHFEVANG